MEKKDIFSIVCIALAIAIALFLLVGSILYAEPEAKSDKTSYISTDYASLIFDDTVVHEIDIQIPAVNWDYMVLHATEEQYVLCDVVIDGERIKDVAIRPKGNSSLKAIKTQGSDRFSFKIEFDHYRDDVTYHGLDKLALNNLGQDVSCMKDFFSYHMMNELGVAAPLSSYAHVTLNGKDFGLYLAVEAIEDSFSYRNYGDDYGNLYKPECFMIDDVTPSAFAKTQLPEELLNADFTVLGPGDRFDLLGSFARYPFEAAFGENMEVAAINYVGEEEERYDIFYDSSVFKLDEEDKVSLRRAFRTLNSEDYKDAIDSESLIRYFVAHNYVNNYDGYTGIFVHNYYLREQDGKLSLIPWDYNLSWGIFTMDSALKSFLGPDSPYYGKLDIGEAMDDATSMVNYPIDDPTFTVDVEDRPLLAAVLLDEDNLELYHQYYRSFLDSFFYSGRFEELYSMVKGYLTPYVEKGETFYTLEAFEKASEAVHDYCVLRTESIERQLDGVLPATKDGQSKDWTNLVDASDLELWRSVTFDSLVFGITSDDIVEVLDAIAGDNTHDSEGFSASIAEVTENPKGILPLLGRVFSNSTLLKKSLASSVRGPILFVLSLVLLLVARKRVKCYKRLKEVGDD